MEKTGKIALHVVSTKVTPETREWLQDEAAKSPVHVGSVSSLLREIIQRYREWEGAQADWDED